jgi:hypothetical protein
MTTRIQASANVPLGVFNVTITASAQTLQQLVTAAGGGALSADRQHFILLPEDGDVRWRDEGTPDAAVGFLLSAGTTLEIKGESRARFDSFKFIRTGAANVAASLWIGG